MRKMQKINEILSTYAVTSTIRIDEEAVDLMMAHIAGEYEGNPTLEDDLEDDIGRLTRYQVGELKITDFKKFQKRFPSITEGHLPEWFFDAVKLEMNWKKKYNYQLAKKIFGYKEAIHFYGEKKPEEVELVSAGFQMRKLFEKDKALIVAEQDFKKLVEEYCEGHKENEDLNKMSDEIKSVIRENFVEIRKQAEDMRERAKV